VLEALHVSASLHFFGPRSGDAGTLPAAVLLGAGAEYRFLKNAGAFLRIENITDQEYELWQGYQERPFFMQAGLTLRI
jgi:outer membrane receptor protein involved in Fe transport